MSLRVICASSLPKARRQGSLPFAGSQLLSTTLTHTPQTWDTHYHSDPAPSPLHTSETSPAVSAPSSFFEAPPGNSSACHDVLQAAAETFNDFQAVGYTASSGRQVGLSLGQLAHGVCHFHSSSVSLTKSKKSSTLSTAETVCSSPPMALYRKFPCFWKFPCFTV